MKGKSWLLLIVMLLYLTLCTIIVTGCSNGKDEGGKGGSQENTSNKPLPEVGQGTVADIVSNAGPAVVKVSTVKKPSGIPGMLWQNPFSGQVPNGLREEPGLENGLGTGFLITNDGFIITNEHVIEEAKDIYVTLDGEEDRFKASLVGSDYDLDLAVIKIEPGRTLPFLKLGDSDKIKVGNWVIAIGNPFGFDQTVTIGVISAKGRPISIENRSYKNLLQTDASINPGNSGGPLLDLKGEVVGINTAVAQAQGIGFAIPANTVKEILDDLIKKGAVIRPWLGVQLQELNMEIASYLGLKELNGTLVVGVVDGSPAHKAGIRQGDVIVKLGSTVVNNPEDLVDAVKRRKVGEKVVVVVFRDGRYRNFIVNITEKPGQIR